MIQVHIGQADVTLCSDERTVGAATGHSRTSVNYEFDDVLHAASRVGLAVLFEDDVKYALEALSDLRRGLAARDEARQEADAGTSTERAQWRTRGAWYAEARRNEARADRAEAEVKRLSAAVVEYESCITWDVTCKQCARYLDESIREHDRAEQAEARLAKVAALCASHGPNPAGT